MFELKKNFTILLISIAAVGCGGIDGLSYEPPLAASDWCANQPCWGIGGLVISQPTSSLLVFILAAYSIFVGRQFFKNRSAQKASFWWGMSLLFGGIGAISAGISYQAFGFEIKCAGQEYCRWTSWWEISYELLTVIAACSMLMAIAHSCFTLKWIKRLKFFAILNVATYSVILSVGLVSLNRFLLSFEMMLLFTAPSYTLILLLNIIQYLRSPSTLLMAYIGAWTILFSTLVAYYFYMQAGYTQLLWQRDAWFSDNDVLHLGMLLWIVYVWKVLMPLVTDRPDRIEIR